MRPAPTRPARVLTVDIGGTKINAAVVTAAPGPGDRGMDLGRVRTTATPAAGGAAAVVAAALELARETLGDDPVDAVGIASAGVIDVATGRVVAATDALPGWIGTDLVGPFARTVGAPAHALNDVHAHGLGEAVAGAGRDRGSLLLIAVGTGIGGALVAGGRVHSGHRGAAGHVGHLPAPEAEGVRCSCGRSGHLEGFASGPGILAQLRRRGGEAADAAAVARAAGEGDPLAVEVLGRAGFATGRTIGALLNILDPAVVAITGGVSRAGDAWWSPLEEGVRHDAMDAMAAAPVVTAQASENAALFGAAHHALTAPA